MPGYAILLIYPDGHVRLSVRRPRRYRRTANACRRRLYCRPSTASLKRLGRLVEYFATYTGYVADDPRPPFIAILDLPS